MNALTPREHEVLALVATGMSNPQVGRKLGISPHTVRAHLRIILPKLGVCNRTQAALVAVGVR